MADDNADWFAAADEPETTPAAAGQGGTADAPAADEAPLGESEAPSHVPEADAGDEYIDPDRLLLFKHWIRPNFRPYKYLVDYRRNYYDDVIDFLDKRMRGIRRDIPHPQTWAERVLRTYTKKSNRAEMYRIKVQDTRLVEHTRFSGKIHLSHEKNYVNRRYSNLLF